MSELAHIPTDEMLNDLAESRIDMFTHMLVGFGDEHQRVRVNRKIIEAIKLELERRGEDVPRSFPHVP